MLGWLSPKIAFALVSFSLGELGDGLNIFQGIYLVGIGWNEGSIGIALSLMGLTALLVQPWAGDIVDKTNIDRRIFLTIASVATALTASAILFVRPGNTDHMLIFITKVLEGIAGSFIGPCLAALTLANFGPKHFDAIMASNILWGHIGSVVAALLAGGSAYALYPNIKYCFLVIGASALVAVLFVGYLPQGDQAMGRGLKGKGLALDEQGHVENIENSDKNYDDEDVAPPNATSEQEQQELQEQSATYWEVFADRNVFVVCVTGFFFHFANANVLLVLGELMGGDNDDGSPKKSAIPLIAGAIVTAQVTMAIATIAGDKLTARGVGRKPLFLAGLATLPIRCALIIYWRDAGEAFLLSTQVFDGLGGGLCGLIHPYLLADIAFGSGRFNVLMGLSASFFGLGATLSNYLGQMIVENMGHVASLTGSFFISIIPVILFGVMMPETMGLRGHLAPNTHHDDKAVANKEENHDEPYIQMT